MIIIPIKEKRVAKRLAKYLQDAGFPFAVEDRSRTTPFFVWIITLPAETHVEYGFARALLADAGVPCNGSQYLGAAALPAEEAALWEIADEIEA